MQQYWNTNIKLTFVNTTNMNRKMAKKKLSQTQIAFIIMLWIVLVVYIILYAQITPFTIMSIIMSGAIVFIPVYKSLKK